MQPKRTTYQLKTIRLNEDENQAWESMRNKANSEGHTFKAVMVALFRNYVNGRITVKPK